MTNVTHEGMSPPVHPDFFDPNSKRWVWWSYPTSRVIAESTFVLPSPLAEIDSEIAVTIVDDDNVSRSNSNGCHINFNNCPDDTYLVTNRVKFNNGDEDDFSVYLIVRTK
jgi:hypothetical protein